MADDVFEKFVGFFCVCTIVSVLYVMDNEGKKRGSWFSSSWQPAAP